MTGVFDADTALGLKIHGVDVAEIERRILASDWLAARVASAAAERDQAVAVADSMCERKSNEYAAENERLREAVERVRGLADQLRTVARSLPYDQRPAYEDAASRVDAALSVPTEAEGTS